MTEPSQFLADTYALIEIMGGNRSYTSYIDSVLATTKFHLAELYYHLLRFYSFEEANRYFDFYSGFLVTVSLSSIAAAMQFKLQHKNEGLSYADCIGYAVAAELGIKFLTGDSKFREKANVEFVK